MKDSIDSLHATSNEEANIQAVGLLLRSLVASLLRLGFTENEIALGLYREISYTLRSDDCEI